MTQICSIHHKNIIKICLYRQCPVKKLCQLCIGDHPLSHNSQLKDIFSLAEDQNWLGGLEALRDELAYQTKLVISEKEKRGQFKEHIKQAFQKIREELTNKENIILKELEKHEDIDSQNMLLKLKETLKSFQQLDFRNSNISQRIATALNFEDLEKIKTQDLLDEARKTLKSSIPDENKLNSFQTEFIERIQSLDLSDFLASGLKKNQTNNEEILKDYVPLLKIEEPWEQNQDPYSQFRNPNLLKNLELAQDWRSCGPKLRFLGNMEIYYCQGKKCKNSERIWGSNPYTCDTDKCTSLRHHGINNFKGGYFLIEYIEGRDSYKSSSKNGIRSKCYKADSHSFNILSKIQTLPLLENLYNQSISKKFMKRNFIKESIYKREI